MHKKIIVIFVLLFCFVTLFSYANASQFQEPKLEKGAGNWLYIDYKTKFKNLSFEDSGFVESGTMEVLSFYTGDFPSNPYGYGNVGNILMITNIGAEAEGVKLEGVSDKVNFEGPGIAIRWASVENDVNSLLKNNNALVKWRFDNGEFHSEYWTAEGTKQPVNKIVQEEGLVLQHRGNNSELKEFVKKIIQSKHFSIAITAYNKETNKHEIREIANFNVEGLGETILPYLREFGWVTLAHYIEY